MSKQDRGGRKGEGFNTPFKDLQRLRKAPEPPKAPVKTRPAPQPRARAPEDDDAALFHAAMDGVHPLPDRGEAPAPRPRLPELLDENAEALAQLAELVSGQGAFDIADTDEYIEGGAPGGDRGLIAALRRGQFSVQGHLDLHGQTQAEAKESVERFLVQSRRAGKRCVLIVHGRGLHSKDQIPVLKERVRVWLSQKRIGKLVLAFATARPHDGGAGAVYVLLRK